MLKPSDEKGKWLCMSLLITKDSELLLTFWNDIVYLGRCTLVPYHHRLPTTMPDVDWLFDHSSKKSKQQEYRHSLC